MYLQGCGDESIFGLGGVGIVVQPEGVTTSPAKKKKREQYHQNVAGQSKKMDLQGIEPWTTPMLREYYTTKPQAQSCASRRTALMK